SPRRHDSIQHCHLILLLSLLAQRAVDGESIECVRRRRQTSTIRRIAFPKKHSQSVLRDDHDHPRIFEPGPRSGIGEGRTTRGASFKPQHPQQHMEEHMQRCTGTQERGQEFHLTAWSRYTKSGRSLGSLALRPPKTGNPKVRSRRLSLQFRHCGPRRSVLNTYPQRPVAQETCLCAFRSSCEVLSYGKHSKHSMLLGEDFPRC
ncbi:uncharacterized protein IWZ02DRAFT_514983, partial [Phyllosticta citriasiana]|uniref:uncharacterized protein n=1 Tax=Phyllosticta citriasiana TaxID=595635 RepID=UPI0030FD5A71